MITKKRKKQSYIDNNRMLEELIDYRQKYMIAKNDDKTLPVIPRYTAECFIKISEKLATSKNYNGYIFKDEMIADAIMCCVMYAHNFDSTKTNNVFAYFTQVAKFAFWQRIFKEKKHLYTKYKAIQNVEIFESFADHTVNDETDDSLSSGYSADSKIEMGRFMTEFEEWMSKRGKKIDG